MPSRQPTGAEWLERGPYAASWTVTPQHGLWTLTTVPPSASLATSAA